MKGIDYLAQNIEPSFTSKKIELFRNNIVFELYRGVKFNYDEKL